jgi:glycosyltransferase involved in cell wall biosynthesis
MRLLFDCTNVFWNPSVNSGIQRVVRNIVANLPDKVEYECVPVVLAGRKLYRVLRLLPDRNEDCRFSRLYGRLDRLSDLLWSFPDDGENLSSLVLRLFSRLVRLPVAVVMNLLRLAGFGPLAQRASPLAAQPEDHLVLLDSTWQKQYFDQVEKLKNHGLKITAVIYDILPLTNPDYFPTRLRNTFTRWFNWVARQADGFACISNAVRDDVRHAVEERIGQKSRRRAYSYFHLGSELDLKYGESSPPADLTAVFASRSPVFLAVGTLEPRKNHTYLFDAFDAMWGSGSEAGLCLIGNSGWKCEELISRIMVHPRYGKSLFWFKKMGDDGLEYAYRHADALIMSSHAEGFGLPIVEALQRGLPVMASDIPVFREIGSDFVAYFDLANPQSLVDLVQAYERTRTIPGVRPPQEWRWIDWKDSARQLVDGVTSGAD